MFSSTVLIVLEQTNGPENGPEQNPASSDGVGLRAQLPEQSCWAAFRALTPCHSADMKTEFCLRGRLLI